MNSLRESRFLGFSDGPVIGLNSFSNRRLVYIWLYLGNTSYCIDYTVTVESFKMTIIVFGYILSNVGQIYRDTEEAKVAETTVWPTPLLIICSLLLKDLGFNFYLYYVSKTTRKRCPLYECPLLFHFNIAKLGCVGVYEGDPRSSVNSCVVSFTIAIFQNGLHQNFDAFSIFPNPITILTESHSNPRCLATRECKVNDLDYC